MGRHLADAFESYAFSPLNAPTRIEGGIVIIEPRKKKVLIYGAGLCREEAQPLLNDPTYEVWAINLIAPTTITDGRAVIRADRWFDLHQREAQSADDMRWIAKCPWPIYLPPDLVEASPNGVLYPLEAIENFFNEEYWACTFAYQIALALYEGFEEIALFGVELVYGSQRERTVEFANVMYWIGRAVERGITIQIPNSELSCLGKHPARYGFEYKKELEAVKDLTDYLDRGDESRRSIEGGGVGIGG